VPDAALFDGWPKKMDAPVPSKAESSLTVGICRAMVYPAIPPGGWWFFWPAETHIQ
jgi:hypothetical protein